MFKISYQIPYIPMYLILTLTLVSHMAHDFLNFCSAYVQSYNTQKYYYVYICAGNSTTRMYTFIDRPRPRQQMIISFGHVLGGDDGLRLYYQFHHRCDTQGAPSLWLLNQPPRSPLSKYPKGLNVFKTEDELA